MSLRVLQVIPTLVRGGAEKQMMLLACGLPRDTFDIHVAVLNGDGPYHDPLRADGIPVSFARKRWKVDPAAYWRLKRVIRRLRPDIVHTWIFAANCYGRQAALACRIKHIVAGERCVDPWKVWHELAIDRHLARRTSRIVTNSNGVREFYVGQGLPAEKFVVIPNGIPDFEVDRPTARAEVRRELNLPDTARLIGSVGRLWPQKRCKDLIWAAELLKAARDDVHLLVVGDGPQRSQLERYQRQVEIEDRVHFLGARCDALRLLAALDCFWLGSGYEGQSNALMEAMMVGLPAVATDIPGNRDLVLHGETGYLVPVGDAAGFARASCRLLDDAALATRLGDAGRARMRREFSVEKLIQRHVELYQQLAGQ